MNLRNGLVGFCIAASVLGSRVLAQEPPKPTDEYKILAADEGTWDATIKLFTAGPNADPTVSKGTEVNEVMAGGFWLLSRVDADFGGVKFQGHGQFGYDPLKKKYVGTWIESMGPMLSVLEGTYDAKTRTMTYVGDGVDAATKAKFTQKWVTTTKSDGTRVFTLFMKYDGAAEEAKFMEITYTKRK